MKDQQWGNFRETPMRGLYYELGAFAGGEFAADSSKKGIACRCLSARIIADTAKPVSR